jgi:hypothetical protein
MDDLFAMRFRSFRVELPRMGNDAPELRRMAREFRGIFSGTLTTPLPTRELE